MINVKYVPPHRRITEEKPKKEEEPNKKEVKKEIEVVASIATKKTKKTTKTNPHHGLCGSGYPRLQRHHRALV